VGVKRADCLGKPAGRRKPLPGNGVTGPVASGVPLDGASEASAPLVKLLTTREVGALLGVAPREAARLIRTRGMRHISLGRKLGLRVTVEDFTRWVEREKARR